MLARVTAAACALVLLASVSVAAFGEGRRRALGSSTLFSSNDEADPVLIEEIVDRLSREALSAPDSEELRQAGVDGVLEALGDEYANYYDEEEYAAFNQALDGEFTGVGLELQDTGDAVVIVRVLEDTPAERAGIQEGERIVSVDGRDVSGEPIDLIVSLVKGEPGTSVKLGLTGGAPGEREITVKRETIQLSSFTAQILEDGKGLVELRSFTSGVSEEVRTAVEQLTAEGAQGVVLDVRGNPGGLLPEAINVASIFIEDGTVLTVRERGKQRRTYAARGDALESIPLVVLVDQYSASASEIVAGAVQDADRGDVVGEPTFGKGSVQTIRRLKAGGGLKFTTAEYFTPSGDSIEDTGVIPDRRATDRSATEVDEALAAAQEALAEALATQS